MVLRVVFLGTGGTHPTEQRNTSSIFVNREGYRFLLDVSEGAQKQMQKYGTGFNLSDIFISKLEADHTAGLPGLMRTLDFFGKEDQLRIFSPPGMKDELSKISLSHGYVSYPVEVSEANPGVIINEEDYQILAFETDANVPSIGYALVEESRPGEFNREKAEELGVPVGPLFGKLHEGEEVILDDGTVIQPDQVVGPARPGRKVVYSGDTRPVDSTIGTAKNADLLIHEAAFDETESETAVESGHSTALEAAKIADEASVHTLVLTNISPRYTAVSEWLKKEAESVFQGNIIVASDGLAFDISFDSGSVKRVNPQQDSEHHPVKSTREQRETLRAQIENLRAAAEGGYLNLQDTEISNLLTSLEKLTTSIDNSVLVLGSYEGESEDELRSLEERIDEMGYDGHLAMDLPEYDEKSLEQNISIYMMLSRFCIMVDREPSGHLNEYDSAQQQYTILARLKPKGTTTTRMIGGHEDVDINYIRTFEFGESPIERIEDAVDWAESVVEARRDTYREKYEWRGI